jgi:hypothetical protein
MVVEVVFGISLLVVVSVRVYCELPLAVVLAPPPVPPFVPVPGTLPTLRLVPLKVSWTVDWERGHGLLGGAELVLRPGDLVEIQAGADGDSAAAGGRRCGRGHR